MNQGVIAPGNQWIFDSLRGAPPRRSSWMTSIQNRRISLRSPCHCEAVRPWQSPPPQLDALKCRLTSKFWMYDVNWCIQWGCMVQEIATGLTPLAMTVVVVTLSRFAGGAVVDLQCTAERHGGRSLHYEVKIYFRRDTSPEVSAISKGEQTGHPGRGVPTK